MGNLQTIKVSKNTYYNLIKMIPKNITPEEFIRYIKKYIPTKSRRNESTNFNLKQVHDMFKEYEEQQNNKSVKDKLDELQNKIILLRYDVSNIMENLE